MSVHEVRVPDLGGHEDVPVIDVLVTAGERLEIDTPLITLETDKGPPKQHRLAPKIVIDELTEAGLSAASIDAGLPDQYTIQASRVN